MKLWKKILFAMAGVVLISSTSLFYLSYTASIRMLEEQTNNNIEDDAFHIMDKIDRMLFEKYTYISILANLPLLRSEKFTLEEITENLIGIRNKARSYFSISYYDLNRVRLVDTSNIGIGEQDKEEGFWQDIASAGISAGSDIRISPLLGLPVVYFASIVKDYSDRPKGVIVTRMPMYKLNEIVKDVSGVNVGGATYEANLLDKEGALLYSSRVGFKMLEEKMDISEILSKIKAGEDYGRLKKCPLISQETCKDYFVTEQGYLDFKGNGWILILRVPEQIIYGSAIKLRNEMIAILVPVVFATIVLALLLARSISGPIRRLSQAVAEIGKGNYDVGVNFKSSDEIGFLANEFSKMVANVRNTRSELENYSKLLERKVVERTKELESLLTEVKDAQNVAFSILEDTVESKNLLEKTLSELKKTQEQLIQAGKLAGIGQMAAGVAHEINNPLTSILGFAQLLLSNRNLDESIASDLRTIEREAKRCVVIIENLLNFSKPNPRKKVPIDIGNVLDDTIKVLVYTLEREKITVIKKCGHGIPKISGDAYQLQQVFMNIIINAARAMPEGGVLTIDVGRDDTSNIQHPTSYVIISFTDTGIGMSDEVKSHIFEPFFSTSYERGQKGTGLGLPISYTIVKEHGGNIEVESEEGKGSTFRVLLPAGI